MSAAGYLGSDTSFVTSFDISSLSGVFYVSFVLGPGELRKGDEDCFNLEAD